MKNIRSLVFIVLFVLLGFYYVQGATTSTSNELVDVKIYEVKDVVHTDTHRTRGRDYKLHGEGYKETYNETYYYDIYIANPSKYPEIKDVFESHLYHTKDSISDNWKDEEGNAGYAVFEIYKDKKTGELHSKLAEVRNTKMGAKIEANIILDGIK